MSAAAALESKYPGMAAGKRKGTVAQASARGMHAGGCVIRLRSGVEPGGQQAGGGPPDCACAPGQIFWSRSTPPAANSAPDDMIGRPASRHIGGGSIDACRVSSVGRAGASPNRLCDRDGVRAQGAGCPERASMRCWCFAICAGQTTPAPVGGAWKARLRKLFPLTPGPATSKAHTTCWRGRPHSARVTRRPTSTSVRLLQYTGLTESWNGNADDIPPKTNVDIQPSPHFTFRV